MQRAMLQAEAAERSLNIPLIVRLDCILVKGEVSCKFAVISKPKNVCLSAETMK